MYLRLSGAHSLPVQRLVRAASYVTPWFSVACLPIGALYLVTVNYFRRVSRESKRLESVARSPVYAPAGASLVPCP